MNEYSFTISLRITHPAIDPTIITSELGINPFRTYVSGVQRCTPKGRLLDGVNRESFWAAKLHDSNNILSKEILIDVFIDTWAEKLSKHQNFLRKITKDRGSIELFIGLFGNDNIGFSLPSLLMKKLSHLNISVGFDIYPD